MTEFILHNEPRTFEEIAKELAINFRAEKAHIFNNRVEFAVGHKMNLVIFESGGVLIEADTSSYSSVRFTPAQLTMISTACAEIAEEYKTLHISLTDN